MSSSNDFLNFDGLIFLFLSLNIIKHNKLYKIVYKIYKNFKYPTFFPNSPLHTFSDYHSIDRTSFDRNNRL